MAPCPSIKIAKAVKTDFGAGYVRRQVIGPAVGVMDIMGRL